MDILVSNLLTHLNLQTTLSVMQKNPSCDDVNKKYKWKYLSDRYAWVL